nr:relaxase/mobilization nuclease domain-containing protein [uncultured Shinella sp.]
MNFQLAAIGHSFKGSMAYYLHDKKQEGMEAQPESAERVAWTETRNLSVTDPQLATSVMIATARSADELKAAAGVRNTGRKAEAGPVFAFSLQWRADELPNRDRAEMVKCANHALRVLGLDHLQAVIVAHQDEPHPHVHVIVNRVDPNTGKTEPIRRPRVHSLNKWAYEYERNRGQIVSPNRAKRFEEIELQKQNHPDEEKRRQYVQDRDAQRQQRPQSSKSPGAVLKDLSDAQKVRHRQEWQDLAQGNKDTRSGIYDSQAVVIREAIERHKTECKPIWASYFRQARTDARSFQRSELGLVGVIKNAMAATAQQRISGQLGNRGNLAATFGNLFSSQARAAAFAQRQELNRQQMVGQLKGILDAEIQRVKERRSEALAEQRAKYDLDRALLIERQDREKKLMSEAWRQYYAGRENDRKPKAAFHSSAGTPAYRAPAHYQAPSEIRAAFAGAGGSALQEKRARATGRGRVRSRSISGGPSNEPK